MNKHYDAHDTAKPGEPTFTLQGGDPHAAKAIIHYADLVRRAGLKLDSPREVRRELHRAAQCEAVAWSFDDYRNAAKLAELNDTPAPERDYSGGAREAADRRTTMISAAKALSNARSQVEECLELLDRAGWDGPVERLRALQAQLLEEQQGVDPRDDGETT